MTHHYKCVSQQCHRLITTTEWKMYFVEIKNDSRFFKVYLIYPHNHGNIRFKTLTEQIEPSGVVLN